MVIERKEIVPSKKQGNPKGKGRARKKQREASSRSVDYRLMKGLGHPLRVEILAILNDRVASPNELSKELEEGLSQVSYHIKVLKDFEMIEMVKTEPKRGAVEHYYRAREEVFLSSEDLKLMPKSTRVGVWGPVLADIEHDIGTSLEASTFDMRPDMVVGRDSLIFDDQACKKAEKLAADFFKKYKQLEVESDQRRQKGEGDGASIPTTAAVLIFGSVQGKKLKSSKGRRRP